MRRPVDPTGPVHERPQSRLAVWHLDPAAGTATLVRSYAPAGWFSWFMGSVQQLPATRNVLIGWAAARNAVATELTPGNKPVWQLVATPSADGWTYVSYRSLKFNAPDTIDPEVTVRNPVKGASYAYGARVRARFSCTDTGGASLRICGHVLPGTLLHTTTPGRHTFTVTAKDGAGNTTTVVRHYTVSSPQPPFRPDALVRRPNGDWLGRCVDGTTTRPDRWRPATRPATFTVPFRLTNNGNRPDRCLVRGRGQKAAFRDLPFRRK